MGRPRVTLDCSAIPDPGLPGLDAILRVRLAAGRGCEVALRGCSPRLRELIRFAGVEDVLSVEVGREPEERE